MAASTLCTVTFCGSSPMYPLPSCSYSSSSWLKTFKFPLSSKISQLGSYHFTPWNDLKYMGISISAKPNKIGRRAKRRGKGVCASLFGVGAPEALVIGVVALLVFGPKGLAEVARNLGKTLRAFQPTIKELQDVSKEFKSTLEREIGLDDEPRSMTNTDESNIAKSTPSSSVGKDFQNVPVADSNGTPSSKAYSSEEYLKITEEQLKASAAVQQDVTPSFPESQAEPVSLPRAQLTISSSSPESPMEPESQPQAVVRETPTVAPSVAKPESES